MTKDSTSQRASRDVEIELQDFTEEINLLYLPAVLSPVVLIASDSKRHLRPAIHRLFEQLASDQHKRTALAVIVNSLKLPLITAGAEEHRSRWSCTYINHILLSLPDDSLWNSMMCILVFSASIHSFVICDDNLYSHFFDLMYNIIYATHVLIIAYSLSVNTEDVAVHVSTILGFVLDIISYMFYLVHNKYYFQGLCYYVRLHRPLRYLWSLNEKKIQSSVLGTTLKYCYIFMVLRLTWAMIWLIINELSKLDPDYPKSRQHANTSIIRFLNDVYFINKMFLPIGPSVAPINNIERVACLMVMLTGCLVVTGAAVASLSLIISIYMRPEENFQTRYRLIMKEMETYNIPSSLRDKVETFYKMYWHKQRAVSATELLPIFPPSLTATIYTDIYFKATQKCLILRDLAYQFLSEVAKNMETIHYIPGDAIIKRNHRKSSIIYITYGDIEMLTAEDDSTAMLRLIRGTILSPCAGCPAAGCGRAHVEIRAATFCTAHVLNVLDLWKTVVKYGKENSQGAMVLRAFNEHFEKVKRHFNLRFPVEAKYKSSILNFKRNLMLLKESRDDEGNLLLAQTNVMIAIAGCYIMRNRADASLTDEADAICLRPTFPCILQPKSSLQAAWNLFVTCLILTVCITHPYYLVFQRRVPIEFRFYDYVVTVIYILDLVVYLSTGANVEDGVPITFAQTSSQQARNKWFVLDVIGTLPILEFIHNGHFAGLNKLLRLPKVFRMLKSIEEECVYHSNVIRFMSFSLLIFLACWLLAALQQGFMCFQFGYCVISNFTHSPYWEQKPLDDETLENRITFGLYWAISVITFTCHLETWGVENWNNTIYTMFVLEICTVLYIFMEAVYSATIMVTTALREDFDACIENVTNFLIRNDVDSILRDRFIEYLQLRWYTDKAYSITNKQTSIFYDLPAHVYQDIVARQRSKYILCIPFMKLLHKEDLKNISSKAKLFCTSPNEILLNTGDMSNEMYVIKRGICEILSPETKNVVGELSARSHFGVIQCLLRLPAFYTVRAVTHVEIFSISRKYLLNAIDIPQIKDAIDFCKDQPQYSKLQKLREPFLSYKPPEPTPNMEKFRLPKKYEQDHAFLQPFYTLGMLSVLRYMFPRFTIRPDSSYLVHYEWIRASCALLSAIVYPCYTYMVLQWPWLYFFTLLLDFSAYFDILQRMLIGYYNEKGILVYHPTSTAGHYLKGAFMVDLFGVLPLERLESSWKKSLRGKYKEAPTKQFLMLNRLIQLYRMPSALLGLTGFIRRDLLLVIKATPIFLALLSVLTCFVVYYSVEIFYSIEDNSWAIVPLKDAGGSWINLFHSTFRFNLTESPWNLHLASYFWVVYETTTTGYSSFKPTNFNIMRVLIAGMIIGAMITTYFSVRIISIRANVNNALASFQEHMKDIGVFMKKEKLNLELQKQVLEYYKFNWDKTGGMDYRNVLKLCDQITLRTDAILHIYGPTFTKCPILYKCDISLLRIIGRAVRSCYFLRNTTVIDVDEVISDIYFVDQGSVELVDSKRLDNKIILTKGSIFGNLEGSSTIRCPVSMTTSTQVHLLQINSQAFFSIICDFPAVAKLLTFYRPSNENYINAINPSVQFSPKEPSVVWIRGQAIANYFQIKQSFIRIYLIIICSLCIYADVYNAGFQDNRPLLIIGLYLLDFCFFWKFLIQYFLPLLVESSDEDVLHSLMKFRNEYFKHEFKYDLISFLPIELLCFLSHGNRGMVFSWLRLNRLWRIVTVYKCLKRHHERISINLTLTTTCSVLIWFTMSVHVSTCLWHFIGSMEEKNTPKSSWIYKDNGEPWCQNDYICSLYFVMTTFTQNGVGDILPKKQSEVMFVSILQIISTMMYMVYVGELSNIIQYQSYRSFYFYSSYLQLQDFLKNNRVSKVLVKLVNKYSLHLWRETRGLQVPYFLKTAPNCLKLKIMSAAYLFHLRDHHLFRGCEPAFLRQLVLYLQLHIYNEDMFIVKEREITDSMYIIHVGRVIETSEKSSRRKSYQAGEYFGELQGIVYDVPFEHSYKTAVKSQILTLSHKDWEDLLTHFPKSKKNIYRYVQSETTSSDGNGDDGIDGRDKNVNFSNTDDVLTSFPKDMSTTTTSQHTSIDTNLRKGSSEHSATPGPSSIRSQSVDNTTSWPLENKKSYDSYLSDTPTLKVESIYTKSQKLIEDKGRTSIMEVKSSTSQYDERSSEIDTKEESIESLSTIQKSDFRSKHDINSVEDYILEQHGHRSSLSKSTGSQSTKSSKRRKTPVRYSDSEPTTSGLDSHELKPRRNKSAEERNLKSLDSEMQEIQIQDLDIAEEDSDKNDNESSVNEKK